MVFQEPIPPLRASSPLIKVSAVSDMELVLSPAPVLLGQQKILQQGLKDSNNLGGKASLWHSCCFLVSARPAPASEHCQLSEGINVCWSTGPSSAVALGGDHWHRDRFHGAPSPHLPYQEGAER